MNGFHFPLFVDLTGKKVVVIGGGVIACRRIAALLDFGAAVTVIAPILKEHFEGIFWADRLYADGDLEGAFLAVAATDDRRVNFQVGAAAHALNIPVSVADCQAECSFYFPAVCVGTDVVAGVVSRGENHSKTAKTARAIRITLAGLEGIE